jgi:hypothetical protein
VKHFDCKGELCKISNNGDIILKNVILKVGWIIIKGGTSGSVVVKALCNKSEGSGFETRIGELLFNLSNSSVLTRPWSLLLL